MTSARLSRLPVRHVQSVLMASLFDTSDIYKCVVQFTASGTMLCFLWSISITDLVLIDYINPRGLGTITTRCRTVKTQDGEDGRTSGKW